MVSSSVGSLWMRYGTYTDVEQLHDGGASLAGGSKESLGVNVSVCGYWCASRGMQRKDVVRSLWCPE